VPTTIEIPRAWLVALAGALLLALLLIAFLVGRESARPTGEAARTGMAAESQALASMDEPREVTETARSEIDPEDREIAPGGQPEPVNNVLASPQDAAPAQVAEGQRDSRRAAVAAYFTQIEGYEQQAKYWSDPKELAMSVLSQGAQGDTSGVATLLTAQRTALAHVESMSVPPLCREHHERTVAVLRRAAKLLETIQGALGSGNIDGLLALSGDATQLESDTRAVDALAAKIKAEVGLSTT
jgi:hypothetical protein